MNKLTFKSLLFHCLLAMSAADSIPYSLVVVADFQGYSNLHNFKGSVESLENNLVAEEGKLPAFEVHVPVAKMKTGNSDRDGNMYSMFQLPQFPEIVAGFSPLDLNQLIENKEPTVQFDLMIRNEKQRINAKVAGLQKTDEEIHFDLQFNVSLKQMKLKAPSAMLGMVRVKDEVTLTTHFHLKTSRLDQLKLKLNQQIGG